MKQTPGHIKGDDHVEFFDANVMPIIDALVKDAGYEGGDDWSLTVFGVHRYGSTPRPKQTLIRMGAVRDATWHIDINIRPHAGTNTYDVRLCVPRSLHFNSVCNELARSIQRHNRAKEPEPAKPTVAPAVAIAVVPPPPPPPKPAELITAGMTRLEGLKNSLEAVLNIGKDAKASAELREEIQARHDAAAAIARPLLAEVDTAETVLRSLEKRRDALLDDIEQVEGRLHRLQKELAETESDRIAAQAAFDRATATAEEPAAKMDAAAAELAEADRLERERTKAINDMPGIAGLLAALNSM